MSFSLERARATIKKVTVDKKTEDDGTKTPTAALKVEVKASADLLAEFHPSLRHALFANGSGVRFPSMKEFGWEGSRRGVDLAIRPGPDMKPALTLQDVTLRDFKKLKGYPDEVLRSAIAAENAASDARPMFVSMIEGELKRRGEEA